VARVVEYTVRNVGKDANYFRQLAVSVTGVDAFTEVHPGLVRFRFVSDVPEDRLKELDKKMREVADGVRASTW